MYSIAMRTRREVRLTLIASRSPGSVCVRYALRSTAAVTPCANDGACDEPAVADLLPHWIVATQLFGKFLGIDERRWLARLQILDVAIGREVQPSSAALQAAHAVEPLRGETCLPRVKPITREIQMFRQQPFELRGG